VHYRYYSHIQFFRSKINELKTECQKMNKEVEEVQSESQTFLSYEKRAEKLANEIKHHLLVC